jgi:hypothetical protein
MMRSSRITTLFAVATPLGRGACPVLVSLLLHSTGFGLLFYGLRQPPRIQVRPVHEPYVARVLNLSRSDPERAQRIDTGVVYAGSRAFGGMAAAVLRAPQTLVQPDAPAADHLLAQVPPIPDIVMWSAEHTPSPIVSARPQPAIGGELRPSLVMPNRALDLADLAVAPTVSVIETPQIASSRTAPLLESAPGPALQIRETEAQSQEKSSSASIVSRSDLQIRKPIVIPLANAAPVTISSEPLVLGSSEKSATGAGMGSGTEADSSGAGEVPGTPNQTEAGLHAASQAGADSGGEPSVTHIRMPKNGQFGVVVVGSSLAEEYPETVAIWSGKLVYTVYLHVGLSKSWTLQFALPRVAEASSATRPEPPWPYEIARPDPAELPPWAMTIHGFINVAGRFERLAVVSPTDFPQAKGVLDTLRQWQFRAARQNGQVAEVEVLLLIPEENE